MGEDQSGAAMSLDFFYFIYFFIRLRQRRGANHQTPVCAPTFATLVPVYCTVTVATGVFRAKEYVVPKEQTA